MAVAYTRHARDALDKRKIREEWVERAIHKPDRVEPDRIDPVLEHRLLAIAEREGRVLRVVVNPSVSPELVITAYFDRGMKGQL